MLPRSFHRQPGPLLTKQRVISSMARRSSRKLLLSTPKLSALILRTIYTFPIDQLPTCNSTATVRILLTFTLCKFLIFLIESALDDSIAADRLKNNSPKVIARIVRLYTLLGDPSSAIKYCEDRAESPPAAEIGQARQMLSHYTQGENFAAGRNGGLALHELDKAEKFLGVGATPSRRYRLLRADCLLLAGREDDATRIIMDLLRSNSRDVDALLLRGRMLYQQGENAKAVAHFQEVLRCDPDHTAARKLLKRSKTLESLKAEGNTAFKESRFEDAKRIYNETLLVDPSNKYANSRLYSNLAQVHLKTSNYEKAIEEATKAIGIDPLFGKPLRLRARANMKCERYEDSVKDFNTALKDAEPGEERQLRSELRSAELELKKSQRKDYYKILGVDKNASDSEIKKAYRKAALVSDRGLD